MTRPSPREFSVERLELGRSRDLYSVERLLRVLPRVEKQKAPGALTEGRRTRENRLLKRARYVERQKSGILNARQMLNAQTGAASDEDETPNGHRRGAIDTLVTHPWAGEIPHEIAVSHTRPKIGVRMVLMRRCQRTAERRRLAGSVRLIWRSQTDAIISGSELDKGRDYRFPVTERSNSGA